MKRASRCPLALLTAQNVVATRLVLSSRGRHEFCGPGPLPTTTPCDELMPSGDRCARPVSRRGRTETAAFE